MPTVAHPPTRSLSTIVVSVVVVLLIAGLFAVQFLSNQNQDVRNKAASDTGQVQVTTDAPSVLTPGQSTVITFSANTNGVQVDGVQLIFDITGDNLAQPTMDLLTSSGLQAAYNQMQPITNGYRVGLIAVAPPGNTFSSTSNQPLAQLTLTAPTTGQVSLQFDNAQSLATVHDSNPPEDQLRTLAGITMTLDAGGGSAGDTTPTPSPDASASPSPDATASPAVSPTPSPTPSPSATPGTGGTTLKSCNESCSSNSECKVDYGCYSNKCRLAANPSSDTCSGPPDNGIQRGCNQYCSNNGECSSGYTCYYNQCRLPNNVTSTTCSAPSTTTSSSTSYTSGSQTTSVTAGSRSCNQACSSNRDCGANLRCYQGACRLNTNPTSPSCVAAPAVTTTPEKGTDVAPPETPQFGATVTPVPSAGNLTPGSELNTIKPRPTPQPTTNPDTGTNSILNQTIFGLPVIILGLAGAGILVAGGIALAAWKLIGRKKGPGSTGAAPKASASAYEADLQAKINSLKNAPPTPTAPPITPVQSAAPTMSQPIGFQAATRPVVTAPPVPPTPAIVPPAPATPPQPPTIELPPTPGPTTQSVTGEVGSSMLQRIRDKGLQPPQSP